MICSSKWSESTGIFCKLPPVFSIVLLQGGAPAWEPPVNLVETDESLWVISALPGVAADRMNVRLEGRELLIAGERPLPKCCNDGELKIWEIPLGRFERRLTLIDGREALSLGEVSLQDGLLIIELGKTL